MTSNPAQYYTSSAAYPLEQRYMSAPLAPYTYQVRLLHLTGALASENSASPG